ncbi:Ger(x)C family spore germination protein [Paenibacillus monticola]|uniref:Ger(X)C family spore germination protein n=1 Tax=Paenibacillus monticola TaxID=2666075 RepID=A0A7X2H8L5_9BACL|nr:Ger(x)C family spore germination protein [Paenibacillus monticola]MRN55516.1 Ger(x)C family spore germination protein [Paenibacillus monticola]
MTIGRRWLLFVMSLFMLPSLSGCWNYAEVEEMSIVAGVAIDKNEPDGKLLLTAELFDTKGQMQQNQASFKIVSLTGETMFDIVRNMISLTGKKLFWSHAKAIILSEEIAREGIIKVIDWYSRDTETRSDVYVFVSSEKTAESIFNLNTISESIMSFEIAQMMRDEKHVSTAPVVEIWDFIDKLETSGKYAIAPLIYIYKKAGQQNERVYGTAIFVKDKMVGKISGEESKYMLFATNKVTGGVLAVNNKEGVPTYSLEVLSNRTELKPQWVNGRLQMKIHTISHTNLDEVMTAEGFSTLESKKEIQKRAEDELQKNIVSVIHKLQHEYHADIFGYGEIIHQDMPKAWKKLKQDWEETFVDMDLDVTCKIIIDSSAKTSRSIKRGD